MPSLIFATGTRERIDARTKLLDVDEIKDVCHALSLEPSREPYWVLRPQLIQSALRPLIADRSGSRSSSVPYL